MSQTPSDLRRRAAELRHAARHAEHLKDAADELRHAEILEQEADRIDGKTMAPRQPQQTQAEMDALKRQSELRRRERIDAELAKIKDRFSHK